jgi:hypothetical protein
VAFHLEQSDGIYLLKSISWNFTLLSWDILQVFCDASGSGMGFWYPQLLLGFQSNIPARAPIHDIFFYEALCVRLAICDVVSCLPLHDRLAVYTDSLNFCLLIQFPVWRTRF